MIFQSIRWYLAYSLSYRDIKEKMKERGFEVDHSTIQRWVVLYSPKLEEAFHKKKRRHGMRWRLDETYIKVNGQWKYFSVLSINRVIPLTFFTHSSKR